MERTSSAELFVPALCSVISLAVLYVQRRHLNDQLHAGADQSEGPEGVSDMDTVRRGRGRSEEIRGQSVSSYRVAQCICILVLALISMTQTITCWTAQAGLENNHLEIEFCPERFSTLGYVCQPSNFTLREPKLNFGF